MNRSLVHRTLFANKMTTFVSFGALLLAPMVATNVAAEKIADMATQHDVRLTEEARKAIEVKRQTRKKLSNMFVQFETPSVSRFVIDYEKTHGTPPSAELQKAHAEKISAEQQALVAELESMGARFISSMRVGANGVKVEVDDAVGAAFEAVRGVKSVAPVEEHFIDHSDSVPWIGGDTLTNLGLDGKDIVIAVIDSGVDYFHASFGGSGDPAAATSNDPNVIEEGTFPTAKVIGGYDFAGPTYAANPNEKIGQTKEPAPDADPLDRGGHGTHVAGSAAGLAVENGPAAGVAPGAKIMALKVFGDKGGSTTLTSDAIEYAMDPNGDGVFDDHVDVINMSLGSNFGSPDTPSAIAANNAAEKGIIVVSAAGNAGNGVPYVMSAPGTGTEVLSVAASLPGNNEEFHLFAIGQGLPERLTARYASISPPLESIDLFTLPVKIAEPLNGCTPLETAFAGEIALIQRGGCGFTAKLQSALDAGAGAVLVFNNRPGGPIGMGGTKVDIPAAMVDQKDGEAIVAAINATNRVLLSFDIRLDPTNDDTLAGFSSRGPAKGESGFKPNVTAPGAGIRSAAVSTGVGARSLSGTSMATPHVAGLAAVMKQRYPDLNQADIRAMLQNSSKPISPFGLDSDQYYPLTLQGVGRVQAAEAIALESLASPGGVSFGRLNPLYWDTSVEKITVKNLTDEFRIYQVSVEESQTMPGVKIRAPRRVFVPPNGSRTFFVRMTVDASRATSDNGFLSQTEVDGWVVLKDERDTLRVGYMAVVDPASQVEVYGASQWGQLVLNSGQGDGLAEGFTVAGLDNVGPAVRGSKIKAFGYRTTNIDEREVLQFGLALDKAHNTPVEFQIALSVDVDQDGKDDYLIQVIDTGLLAGGDPSNVLVSTVSDLSEEKPEAKAQYIALADNNDSWFYFTVNRTGEGGVLVNESTKFDYSLLFYAGNPRTGNGQVGSIDLADETILENYSLSLGFSESQWIRTLQSTTSQYMWLLPNDLATEQVIIY